MTIPNHGRPAERRSRWRIPARRTPLTTAITCLATCLAAVSLWVPGAGAAPVAAAQDGDAPPRTEPPDPSVIADFFDGRMDEAMAETDVPGAVVSVVSGGEVVFSAGYGSADLEAGTPMDPERSLVRIASISKLFTFTAVMQLVEQGRLDLDADINSYLTEFEVPPTYPEPVTLRHLLSHTAGFEDRGIGTGARSADDVPELVDFLEDHQPDRVRPPGRASAYSNYGAGLAGYVVGEVSGEGYEEYVESHILDELGMDSSTAHEPLPPELADNLAASYAVDGDGELERRSFVYDVIVPDGSVSTTAADMTSFMLAHLGHGTEVLEPATREEMQTRAFSAHPAIDGWTLGFKERTFNGHRVIMHDGSWQSFQSVMLLVPDTDLGVFIAANSDGGVDLLTDVMPAFFDEVLEPGPGRPVPDGTDAGLVADAGPINGFYRLTRSSENTIEKLLTLVGGGRASVGADGMLRFRGTDWEPLVPGLYQEVDGEERLAVVETDGELYLATDRTSFVRQPSVRTPPFNLMVILVVVVAALLAVVGWPLAAGVRRLRGRTLDFATEWRRARWLTGGAAGVALLFLVLLTAVLLTDTSDVLYGPPFRIRLLMLLPILFVALLMGAVAITIVAWRQQRPSVLRAVLHVVVLLGLSVNLWFLQEWNLLGWQFG